MLKRHWMVVSLITFFWSVGSVYSDPGPGAIGEDMATAGGVTAPSIYDEPAESEAEGEELVQKVGAGAYGKVDIIVKELEIAKVLQLLSLQSKRNIIANRDVSGTISATLHNVDFYEALEAVLIPNGFVYREKGNFIYVYTTEYAEKMDDRLRQTKTEVLRLNYLSAKDAATYVQPLLSPAGTIVSSRETPAGIQPSISDAGADTHSGDGLLVIKDYPENIAEIRNVIEQLDVRPKQVEIEVYILKVNLSDVNRWGVDFSVVADLDISMFSNPLSSVKELFDGTVKADGTAISSEVGNTGQDGGFKIGVTDNNVAVFIDALAQVTDTTLLAKPKLLVLNRQRADLLIGGREGYPTSTTTDTATSTAIEFLETGTQLTVRPFISNDGYIRLELRPSISDGSTELLGDTVVPRETTQELTTNVLVRTGQTVILGGLFKEETTISQRQVPFLGDVPIAGVAFRGQNDTIDRDEYIFMVRPTIVKDEQLIAKGEQGLDGIELARIGAREGLLPWSRDKLVAYHMQAAMDRYKQGDVKKALMFTNWALNIDPNLVQAQRFKERLTGDRMFYPKRGILENAINNMVEQKVGQIEVEEPEPTPDAQAAADTQQQAQSGGEAPVDEAQAEAQVVEEPVATAEEPADEAFDVDWAPPVEPILDVDVDLEGFEQDGTDDEQMNPAARATPGESEGGGLMLPNPLGDPDAANLAEKAADDNQNPLSDETPAPFEPSQIVEDDGSAIEKLFDRLNEWMPTEPDEATAVAEPDETFEE